MVGLILPWGFGVMGLSVPSLVVASWKSLLLEFQCSGILGGLFLLLVALP